VAKLVIGRPNKRLKLTGGEGCAPLRPLEARGFLSRRPQLKRVLGGRGYGEIA
jgi:hypothetical protein